MHWLVSLPFQHKPPLSQTRSGGWWKQGSSNLTKHMSFVQSHHHWVSDSKATGISSLLPERQLFQLSLHRLLFQIFLPGGATAGWSRSGVFAADSGLLCKLGKDVSELSP